MSESRGERDEMGRQRKRERARGRSKSEQWQHDMFGPEEVKQRGSEAESGREERWRETERDQPCPVSQSTGLHTSAHSIHHLVPTHEHTDTHREPPNGLLHSPFPYNPCLPALLMHLSYLYSRSFICCYWYYYGIEWTAYSVSRKGLWWYSCGPFVAWNLDPLLFGANVEQFVLIFKQTIHTILQYISVSKK